MGWGISSSSSFSLTVSFSLSFDDSSSWSSKGVEASSKTGREGGCLSRVPNVAGALSSKVAYGVARVEGGNAVCASVASGGGSSRSSSSWSFEIGGVICRGMGGGNGGWSVVPSKDKFVSSSSTAESNNGPTFGSETVSSSRIVLDLGVALSTFASLSNDGWNNPGLCRVPILFGGDGV